MKYGPIRYKKFEKEALKDSEVHKSYDELEEEFTLAMELIKARKRVRKSQQEVAKQMQTSQATIARIESGYGQKKHSPSIKTLRRYAKAVGCKVLITFVPKKKISHNKFA